MFRWIVVSYHIFLDLGLGVTVNLLKCGIYDHPSGCLGQDICDVIIGGERSSLSFCPQYQFRLRMDGINQPSVGTADKGEASSSSSLLYCYSWICMEGGRRHCARSSFDLDGVHLVR